MEYVYTFPETELIKMWDRSFREDYKRRGYELEDENNKKIPNEQEKERLKNLYEW